MYHFQWVDYTQQPITPTLVSPVCIPLKGPAKPALLLETPLPPPPLPHSDDYYTTSQNENLFTTSTLQCLPFDYGNGSQTLAGIRITQRGPCTLIFRFGRSGLDPRNTQILTTIHGPCLREYGLQQEWANSSPQAKSIPLPLFVWPARYKCILHF